MASQTYPNSLPWTRHRRVRRNTAAEVQIPRRGWVKWHNDWCLGRWKWLADFAARKWWHWIVFTYMATRHVNKSRIIFYPFLDAFYSNMKFPLQFLWLLEEKRRVSQHSWKLTFLLGTPKVIPPIRLCGGYWPLSALMNVASWERIRDGHPQSSGAWHKRFKRRRTIRSNLAWNKYAYECMWCIHIYIIWIEYILI